SKAARRKHSRIIDRPSRQSPQRCRSHELTFSAQLCLASTRETLGRKRAKLRSTTRQLNQNATIESVNSPQETVKSKATCVNSRPKASREEAAHLFGAKNSLHSNGHGRGPVRNLVLLRPPDDLRK